MNVSLLKGVGALAIATMLSISPGLAQTSEVNEPWCGTDRGGAMSCIYPTLRVCESVVRAEGGECVPDPRASFVPPEELDD
jgi:hypothetical protein